MAKYNDDTVDLKPLRKKSKVTNRKPLGSRKQTLRISVSEIEKIRIDARAKAKGQTTSNFLFDLIQKELKCKH
jgi:hypothetical protein